MQLSLITFLVVFIFFVNEVKAQIRNIPIKLTKNRLKDDSSRITTKVMENPAWKTIDVNFLSSYYQQDGNNSPVTGGIGTEQLSDFTQKIIVSNPLTEKLTLKIDGGYDYYTSASTDNIDNIKTSESYSDIRAHSNVGISYKKDKQNTVGFRLGGSVEYDYTSFQLGFNYAHLSKDKNTGISLATQLFIDNWQLIYPIELRGIAITPATGRQSYNIALGFSKVVTKKMQLNLMGEAVAMNGLLSTPFHRVYFKEQTAAKIENLPSFRLKVPLGIRLNYYVNNRIIVRTYYRYYWDNWGITANTASIELPIKINRFMAIYPHYRFHKQTAADNFLGYKEHSINNKYYTSDYDLSALSSHNYGIGLIYSPVDDIFRIKKPLSTDSYIKLKSIDLKYSHYTRSTGMQSDILSFGLGFSI